MTGPTNTSVNLFAKLPDGEVVVSITVYKDELVVASNKSVYYLDEKGTLTPIPFEEI